jgi:uncharacterized membrane protein
MGSGIRAARALGFFSLVLGIVQLIRPERILRLIGLRSSQDRTTAMRLVGARELVSGVGLVARPQPVLFAWSRVAGDLVDLALLSRVVDARDARRDQVWGAIGSVAGILVVDLATSIALTRGRAGQGNAIQVRGAITVDRPLHDVYQFWRDFENLPRFMRHLEEVRSEGGGRSHWRAAAPAGTSVEWDARLVDDRPNERISWRSIEGSDIPNEGEVRFRPAPGEQGTEVVVDLAYQPPAGKLGAVVAKLFGEEPSQQVAGDLRRFKQVMEAGEVVLSDATLDRHGVIQRPAQPVGANGR